MEATLNRPTMNLKPLIIFALVLCISAGIAHAISKHGANQVESALQCRQKPDFIFESLSGSKLFICKLDDRRWGAKIEQENGEDGTAFVNNLKSILKWARNQGYNKVNFANSDLIDDITKILLEIR